MKEKVKQLFSDKLSKKNLIIVIAVIGILCIALSEINFSGSEKKNVSNEENYSEYVDSLNSELTRLISRCPIFSVTTSSRIIFTEAFL